MVAMGGEDQAKMAGDFGHDAMLGTTLLGTTENEFLAIDRWSSDDNIDAFYGDPNFQMAFGALFETPPAPSMYIYQDTWAHWGGSPRATPPPRTSSSSSAAGSRRRTATPTRPSTT